MTDVVALLEHEIVAGWHWLQTEAAAIYHAVLPLVSAPLKAFELTVTTGLFGAAAAFVQKALSFTSLADLETAFLNTVQLVGHEIFAAAQALGSALLQSLLGLLSAQANVPTAVSA